MHPFSLWHNMRHPEDQPVYSPASGTRRDLLDSVLEQERAFARRVQEEQEKVFAKRMQEEQQRAYIRRVLEEQQKALSRRALPEVPKANTPPESTEDKVPEEEPEVPRARSSDTQRSRRRSRSLNGLRDSSSTDRSRRKSAPGLTTEDKTKILNQRLELYGLKEKTQILGDGNCQFAAIADQIYGDPEYAQKVREFAVAWLRKNPDFKLRNGATIKDFLQVEFFPTWEDYCDYMETPGMWGDHLTLTAISELYNTRIFILSSVEGTDPSTIIVPSKWSEGKTIYLSHLHELHYGSLTPADDFTL